MRTLATQVQSRNSWLMFGAAAAGLWYLNRSVTRSRYSFQDRVVVITGGSRGLGLVLARQFAKEGAKLVLLARDGKELSLAQADLREEFGVDVHTLVCDVTQAGEVRTAFQRIQDRFGCVDVLINNAGMIRVAPFENTTPSDYRAAMDIHFWGTYNCSVEALPLLKRSSMPRIVNIASFGGLVSVPHLAPYCASKFAVVGFSRGLRTELSRYGIKVTTVCPGTMRTGSYRQAEFKGDYEKEYRWFAVGASVPGLSMSAERAARRIMEAARVGRAELVTPAHMAVAVKAQTVFPNSFAGLLSLVNRWVLPAPKESGISRKGAQIPRSAALDAVTTLSRKAAVRNNEYASLIHGQT